MAIPSDLGDDESNDPVQTSDCNGMDDYLKSSIAYNQKTFKLLLAKMRTSTLKLKPLPLLRYTYNPSRFGGGLQVTQAIF